ncbi:hypothetical protein CPHO_11450 [Corynebacterium phocae]|uniref:Uncharacterized protein n=1 Tax=Corynebacterium phocae TaxID=161895 RepID=A0A1L7D5L3_9CORY|nr:hypothetical protein CPHO_11450 [Corynebacterium phocae]
MIDSTLKQKLRVNVLTRRDQTDLARPHPAGEQLHIVLVWGGFSRKRANDTRPGGDVKVLGKIFLACG